MSIFCFRQRVLWRGVGALLATVAALALLNVGGSVWLWDRHAATFEKPRRPPVESRPAAVVFYTGIVEDARRRLDHALALRERGAINHVLIVGGYRGDKGYNGAADLAARARFYVSEAGAVAHDIGSYDTLSNLEAICDLRAAAAPGSSLVLVSDSLHMVRIWAQRWRINCVDDRLLGYDTITGSGGLLWRWYQAQKHWLAEAARLLLGEGLYRAALHQWRRHQQS
jgi:hypothetical protein